MNEKLEINLNVIQELELSKKIIDLQIENYFLKWQLCQKDITRHNLIKIKNELSKKYNFEFLSENIQEMLRELGVDEECIIKKVSGYGLGQNNLDYINEVKGTKDWCMWDIH